MKLVQNLLFFFLLVSALPVMASSELYKNCVEVGTEEQMQGWEESDRYSVKRGVESACKMLLEECEQNPQGELCLAFKKKFGARSDSAR